MSVRPPDESLPGIPLPEKRIEKQQPSIWQKFQLRLLARNADSLKETATKHYRLVAPASSEDNLKNQTKIKANIRELRQEQRKLIAKKEELEKAFGTFSSKDHTARLLQITENLRVVEKLCQAHEETLTFNTLAKPIQETKENIARLDLEIKSRTEDEAATAMRLNRDIPKSAQLLAAIADKERQTNKLTLLQARLPGVQFRTLGPVAHNNRLAPLTRRVSDAVVDFRKQLLQAKEQQTDPDRAGYYINERIQLLEKNKDQLDEATYQKLKGELLTQADELLKLSTAQKKVRVELLTQTEVPASDAPIKDVAPTTSLLVNSLARYELNRQLGGSEAGISEARRDFENMWWALSENQQMSLLTDEEFHRMFTRSGLGTLQSAIDTISQMEQSLGILHAEPSVTGLQNAQPNVAGPDPTIVTWTRIFAQTNALGAALQRTHRMGTIYDNVVNVALGASQRRFGKLCNFLNERPRAWDTQQFRNKLARRELEKGSREWKYLEEHEKYFLSFGNPQQKAQARTTLDQMRSF
jgi:hypothetical protein